MNSTITKIRDYLIEEYVFYFKGIELGGRTERKMQELQDKFTKLCDRYSASLVAMKDTRTPGNNNITLSFVPNNQMNGDMIGEEMQNMLTGEGDEIVEAPGVATE